MRWDSSTERMPGAPLVAHRALLGAAMVYAMTGGQIPKDHIKLTEAYRLFRMARRGTDSSSPQLWYKARCKENNADEEELAQPFKTGCLQALTSASDGQEYRIPRDNWNDASWPKRMFLLDSVFQFDNNKLEKLEGRTHYVRRAPFEEWLGIWLRERLFDELKDGRIKLDAARDLAKAVGIESLEGNPSPEEFNPMAETFWTLPMAVAWLAYGATESATERVREKWKAYKEKCRDFHCHELPPGIDGEIHEGCVLVDCPAPSLTTFQKGAKRDARDRLRKWFEEGTFVATGVSERDGKKVKIPVIEWEDLSFFTNDDGDDVVRPEGGTTYGYKKVMVKSTDVMALQPAVPADDGAGKAIETVAEAPIVVPSRDRPVSEEKLRAAYKEWRAGQKKVDRASTRQWGTEQFGKRITVARLDALDKQEATLNPRKSGRPKA